MASKEKCTVVMKTTKMALKVNGCVKKEVHYQGVQMRHSRRYLWKLNIHKKIRVWIDIIVTVVEAAKAYDAAAFMFHRMKVKANCLFAASPVNWPPRKNSSIESVNAVLVLESLFQLDLSFRSSYSSSYVGVFTYGVGNFMFHNPKLCLCPIASGVLPLNQWCRKEITVFIQGGGGGGFTISITGASSLVDYPSTPEDM